MLAVTLAFVTGCGTRAAKVPGETDISVYDVTISGKDGDSLNVDAAPLYSRLGMRPHFIVIPRRYYSEFREAEDQRRITAFWQTHGYFDVEVDPPKTTFSEDRSEVTIDWTVKENQRYAIAEVVLKHAPPEYKEELEDLVPFEVGDGEVNLETFRRARSIMAVYLRDRGYGHAMVYSRTWVDRRAKKIHWYYFVDAGPKTRVGKVVVQGNHKIPAEVIIDRVGLKPGDIYAYGEKLRREFDLLDTGAFASTFVRTTADTVFIVPGVTPDTGGVLRPEQVDDDGNLVPRKLPEEVDLKIHVVEAPSQQLRFRAGFEIDSKRADTTLSGRMWFRNLFAPMHHLTVEGRIGYGWLFADNHPDPSGLYGSALIRTLHPSAIGRIGDLRLTARFRNDLYPGFHLNEVTAGPGLRATLEPGLFFDVDALFRYGLQVGFGPFSEYDRDRLALADSDEAMGAELSSSLIWDKRNNPVSATYGHYLGLTAAFSPGPPLGTHRYLSLLPDARAYLNLDDMHEFALAGRATAGWIVGYDRAKGVPLGPRFFGGGPYGFRGFARQRLSPVAQQCLPNESDPDGGCQGIPVGGLSSLESSVELRWYPSRLLYGGIVFADLGGVGGNANPFQRGVNAALGVGFRLRTMYLPTSLDLSYRLLDRSTFGPPGGRITFMLRLGEAF